MLPSDNRLESPPGVTGLVLSLCNANPVLRVDSSTTDPPFWMEPSQLYHSSFLGICIIAWVSHSCMNHVLADSKICKAAE